MAEIMDSETRSRIYSLERDFRELASAFWGDNVRRDNGLRSEVRELQQWSKDFDKRFTESMNWAKHIWEVDRENECFGLKALAKYESENSACEDEEDKEEVDMQIAKMNAHTLFWSAAIPSALTVVGQIILAILISKLQKGGQ